MPLTTVHGTAVEYSQAGAGPDLLLLHSLLTDASVFARMAPALESAHRVTCVNLPGFGRSAPRSLDSIAAHADHVGCVMDELALAPTTDVFGNGFGAFVALQLALRHGARLRNLVVADVVPAFPEAGREPFRAMAARVRESGMPAVLDAAVARMFPPAFQARFPQVVADRKDRLARVDPGCFARACLALAALERPALAAIRNRTLVLCGALDQTTPPALAREVADAIPGALYAEIAGSGHCPMLEQPDTLVASLGAFVAAPSLVP